MSSKRASASSKSKESIASADDGPDSELPVMTLEEVRKHAADDDCFLAVDGFVCNVTHYLDDHPGSAEQLTSVAGEDATEEFFDHTHSLTAIKKMKSLAVARLPDGEGKRKADLGGGFSAGAAGGSSSFMVVAIIAVLALLGVYYAMSQQE